jgi:hypothetical protein
MAEWGYRNLTGVEPFIKADIAYPSGVKVYKSDIFDFAPPPRFNSLIMSKLTALTI